MSTTVTIGDLPFQCDRLGVVQYDNVAAVYVIICVDDDGTWQVLDVGETGELGDRLEGHEREDCWRDNCPGNNIWVCVYYTPSDQYSGEDRKQIESMIRKQYNPPCGTR